MGKSICVTLLDLIGQNPVSRLIKVKGENVEQAVDRIRKEIKREIERPKINKKLKSQKSA